MFPINDEYWMAQALQVARKGFYSTHPNPRVGCVVVSKQTRVSQGWHEFSGGPHAEINAIENTSIPPASYFYVTLEPCSHQGKTPPCVDELIRLKPARVIIAMQDPNPLVAGQGIEKLKAAGIEVVQGTLESEARALNAGFVSRMERKRPFLRLKMAMSLDGRTALANGASRWITGEAARFDVQRLRAQSSAIMTSAATIIADDPLLNLRLTKAELGQVTEVREPVRVVLDSKLRLTGNEKIFGTGGAIWIYTLSNNNADLDRLKDSGASVKVLETSSNGHIDLVQLMSHLAAREINEVHSECGATLAGALIRQQLVDELVVYIAPHLLGNQSRGLFDLGEITNMDSRVNCRIDEIRQIGEDIRLRMTLERQVI
jgi:diaminohydroxyphosphoribosylaminopyrimidine deaminase/5-amino-6-(5-phosphoribosylamino)uracil reductase